MRLEKHASPQLVSIASLLFIVISIDFDRRTDRWAFPKYCVPLVIEAWDALEKDVFPKSSPGNRMGITEQAKVMDLVYQS